jgi:hypothetical protein
MAAISVFACILGAGLGASTLAGQDQTGGAQVSSQRRVGEGSPAPGAGDVPRAADKKDYQRRLVYKLARRKGLQDAVLAIIRPALCPREQCAGLLSRV